MSKRYLPSLTVLLLNLQYTIGYLAAGFLISVPIQMISRQQAKESWWELLGSLQMGLLCIALYFLFWPIVRYYDWGNMKLPEFKLFELSVTRNATLASLALVIASFFYVRLEQFKETLWLLFLLEGLAYLKLKAHTLIFRDFYAIERKVHEQQWYENLTEGLRGHAREVQGQIREVQGHLKSRLRYLETWARNLTRKKQASSPEPKPPQAYSPMPCRYHGRNFSGRIVMQSMPKPDKNPSKTLNE